MFVSKQRQVAGFAENQVRGGREGSRVAGGGSGGSDGGGSSGGGGFGKPARAAWAAVQAVWLLRGFEEAEMTKEGLPKRHF